MEFLGKTFTEDDHWWGAMNCSSRDERIFGKVLSGRISETFLFGDQGDSLIPPVSSFANLSKKHLLGLCDSKHSCFKNCSPVSVFVSECVRMIEFTSKVIL